MENSSFVHCLFAYEHVCIFASLFLCEVPLRALFQFHHESLVSFTVSVL